MSALQNVLRSAWVEPVAEPLLWLWQALRDWRWAHTAAALFVGMFTLSNMGGALFFGQDFPWLRSYVYNALQFGFPCVLWLLWANRAVQQGNWPMWLSYAPGVPFVAFTGVWIWGPRISDLIGGDANWNANNDRMLAAAVCVPLALVFAGTAYWHRSQRAQAALREASQAREQQAQALTAAKLLALQARMEPQLLFDTLKRIRDHVGVDDARADQTLLDLIALLRAMQPHAQARSSTLGRELALIEGFGKVTEQAQLLPPQWQALADEEAKRVELAPLLLLPLLRGLIQHRPGPWRMEAALSDGQLRMHFLPPSTLDPALDLSGFAERLSQVHGAGSTLRAAADGVHLTLAAVMPAETLATG